MKTLKKLLLCSLMIMPIWFCNNSRKEERPPSPSRHHTQIPPNACRIWGTIVRIDSTLETAQKYDPKAKAPSLATVRVDSILGYGPGFTKPLAVGRKIDVWFRYTLSPTKDLFPKLRKQHLPGLSLDSKMQADVLFVESMHIAESEGSPFFIDYYQRIKP